MSRQSEFQFSPSLWLPRTNVAKAKKGCCVSFWPTLQMRGCCGAVAAPNYYQTAANTWGYSEGAQSNCQARGQALQCGEATGSLLCSSLPSVHSHAMRLQLQTSAPAASSSSLPEIAGWQGNHVCKYGRPDKEMSWSLFNWLGLWGQMYACLDPCAPWQRLNSGQQQERLDKNCN